MAVLGKTGSGKSFMTRGLVEHLLGEGRRVCILDYTGVWFGLRSNASGKRAAYPIVIPTPTLRLVSALVRRVGW
jgi:DNA helicase HerA-like ATPase